MAGVQPASIAVVLLRYPGLVQGMKDMLGEAAEAGKMTYRGLLRAAGSPCAAAKGNGDCMAGADG